MKMRALLLIAALAMLLFAGSLVNAQELDPCFGLSAEDCEYINTASANTLAAAESFFQDISIDFSLTGIPDAGNITFNLTGSGPVVMTMADAMDMSSVPLNLAMTMDVAFSGADESGSGTLEVRLVDNIFYFQNPEDPTQWASIDLAEAQESGATQGLPVPTDPEAIAGLAEGLDMTMLAPVMGLFEVPGFLNYVRAGDTFTFTADLGTLFSSEEFTAISETIAEQVEDFTVVLLVSLLPEIVENGVITVTQGVDPASTTVNNLGFNVAATLNAAALDPSLSDPITLELDFNVAISQVNEAFEIVAPENAQAIPLDGMGMGG